MGFGELGFYILVFSLTFIFTSPLWMIAYFNDKSRNEEPTPCDSVRRRIWIVNDGHRPILVGVIE